MSAASVVRVKRRSFGSSLSSLQWAGRAQGKHLRMCVANVGGRLKKAKPPIRHDDKRDLQELLHLSGPMLTQT